ncbi:uncharacterized protein LOC114365361 [Ostrinia furnacalis]|uniref:uncharacterized protein LOC114365361 n=1 Tax=Ostrinia furnacalis TaxID=93504 RepID=UPI00104003D2|nr:uncharacterized protein LOC114365361 [Ostrinia furnacalis]
MAKLRFSTIKNIPTNNVSRTTYYQSSTHNILTGPLPQEAPAGPGPGPGPGRRSTPGHVGRQAQDSRAPQEEPPQDQGQRSQGGSRQMAGARGGGRGGRRAAHAAGLGAGDDTAGGQHARAGQDRLGCEEAVSSYTSIPSEVIEVEDVEDGELTRQGWVPARVLQEASTPEQDKTALAARRQ